MTYPYFAVTTQVHYDDTCPRAERWKVLRGLEGQDIGGEWLTVESFSTEREAKAFARGFTIGMAYAPARGNLAHLPEIGL